MGLCRELLLDSLLGISDYIWLWEGLSGPACMGEHVSDSCLLEEPAIRSSKSVILCRDGRGAYMKGA